ncbi:serine hydrolase domain-containing protein, partial [Streptomyces sp. NPDC020800]|uniref:serine hydrolase domain-containing protein n=1 Tax=Streptomyces sp. NPDC020800 TaxID=3365092 RepID=UPI0037B20272
MSRQRWDEILLSNLALTTADRPAISSVPRLAPRRNYDVRDVNALLADAVRRRVFPGAVWAVGDASGIWDIDSTGLLDPDRGNMSTPTQIDTLFDVASMSKILATWSAIGVLWEQRRLNLRASLGSYWPETTQHPIGELTAHHLLTHTAGLPLRAQLKPLYGTDLGNVRRGILAEPLHRTPGQAVEYTDRAAMILGFLAEYLTGERLDTQAARVWRSLGLRLTQYGPMPAWARTECAPTELDPKAGQRPRGTVHDYSGRLLGPSCGSAGVFSDTLDVSRFLRYLLGAEPHLAHPGFGQRWVRESLQVHT